MITCYLLTSAGQTYSESYRWRSLILPWEESFRCVTHTDTSLEVEVLEELEKSRWAIANYGPALKQICWSLTFSNQLLSHGTSPILSVNTLPCRSVDPLPPASPTYQISNHGNTLSNWTRFDVSRVESVFVCVVWGDTSVNRLHYFTQQR